jgi:hypothetical protein
MTHKGAPRVTKDTKDHIVPKAIPFPNHTLYSRENPRPLVIASSSIMIVVHFAKVASSTHE